MTAQYPSSALMHIVVAQRGSVWQRVAVAVKVMWRVALTRRHLAEMDERMLKDIGISRTDALEEMTRAPWDVAALSLHRARHHPSIRRI